MIASVDILQVNHSCPVKSTPVVEILTTLVDMKRTLGERMRAERESRQQTQQQVADLARVSKQAISKIENGGTTDPEYNTLDRIASAWGISTRWLADERGPRERSEDDPDWPGVRAYAQAVGLGEGVEADEYAEAHKLKFRASSLAKKRLKPDSLRVFYGKGDSMLPRVRSGDAVLFDIGDSIPRDGVLYVIQVHGVANKEYQVKRALILDDVVFFAADNPSGDHGWIKPRRMDAKRSEIEVIGRVRWIGSWED